MEFQSSGDVRGTPVSLQYIYIYVDIALTLVHISVKPKAGQSRRKPITADDRLLANNRRLTPQLPLM